MKEDSLSQTDVNHSYPQVVSKSLLNECLSFPDIDKIIAYTTYTADIISSGVWDILDNLKH